MRGVRARAKARGLLFDLDLTDFVCPTHCPILGIPLVRATGVHTENSPTLDRVDTEKGYVKGNVCIISFRANRMKGALTVVQLERLLSYIKGEGPSTH